MLPSRVSTVATRFFHVATCDHQIYAQSHPQYPAADHTCNFVYYALVTVRALVIIVRT